MFTPQYHFPASRGALTEDQFGALEVIEYVDRRVDRIIRRISLPLEPEAMICGPANPAMPPIQSAARPVGVALH